VKIFNTPAYPIQLVTDHNINPVILNIMEHLLKHWTFPFVIEIYEYYIDLENSDLENQENLIITEINKRCRKNS